MVRKLCCDSDDSYYSHVLKIPESVTRKDDGSVSKHTRSLRPRTKSSSDNSSGSSSSSTLYKEIWTIRYNRPLLLKLFYQFKKVDQITNRNLFEFLDEYIKKHIQVIFIFTLLLVGKIHNDCSIV
ncbi:844_t:CDS:2 [Rhizophagus irregularis]|nr:844_t:CDS:2 [Rhizophagus irregularis]